MKDSLGDRMKENYEDRTRMFLPRRTYTIIRVDGKAFHTFTKHCERPFDQMLCDLMNKTAQALCKQVMGAKLAYVQSDEISIVLTDFDGQQTQAWFDGNIQKMVSISAAIATAAFNEELQLLAESQSGTKNRFNLNGPPAMFDSRVFTIPDPIEVENYLIWRQQDATRNSVQMATRAVYSHKECEGKDIPKMHDMLMAKGINWNDYDVGHKRGRCIVKETFQEPVRLGMLTNPPNATHVSRSRWTVVGPPIFTQDRNFIRNIIPVLQPPTVITVNELNND